MQLGMIGLGRMGGNMVRRLVRGGHLCVVFDLNPDNVKTLASQRTRMKAASVLAYRLPGPVMPLPGRGKGTQSGHDGQNEHGQHDAEPPAADA